MLRRFVPLATLLALPLAAAHVAGSWSVQVHIGDRTGHPKFAFKQNGEALSGKYEGQLGNADVKGTVKGKIDFDGQGEGEVQGKKI